MTRAALKHGEESLRLAMIASDVATLDRLLHDALIFVGPSGQLVRKEDDLDNHRSGKQRISKLSTRDIVTELIHDDVGIVSVLAEIEGTFAGAPFAGTFRHVRTWHREHDGTWRVVSGAVLPVS